MRTRDFAAKYIVFSKSSPVTGPFRLPMYPMLGKPMDAADDIRIKRLVIFKASSCLGTVLGQIINTKRIACDVGDQKMVCQTDQDAATWTKTRGKEWLESVPDVMRLLKASEKYAQTQELWLFRHKFLEISGPGINSAQSVQVRYVQTDESHLEAYPNGRLVEFEKRMGGRWDAQGTHITTAPDVGREVDGFYEESNQNEWHWRCDKCNNLVWPLWEDRAQKLYNGERIFQWDNEESETATLDSIRVVCPHCQKVHMDNDRERYGLNRDGDYVAQKPDAPIECAGFRWSVFAGHWITWRSMLAEYLAALRAVRQMDLKKHEDWVKKRECFSYRAEPPDLGEGCGSSDYKVGSVWITEHEKLRVCSFDVQEADGFHLWGQCDEFLRNGDSRRVDYQKLLSWNEARAFQQHHGVQDQNTQSDAGFRMREVFAKCAAWHWFAMFSEDATEFAHEVIDPRTKGRILVRYPYSDGSIEDPMSGVAGNKRVAITNSKRIPPGFCGARRWSKPVYGGYLMALKAGKSRYYGIASDINPEYLAQLNSYTFTSDYNKKTGVTSVILKQIKKDDHSFATSSLNLVRASIRGYFPLSNHADSETKPEPIAV